MGSLEAFKDEVIERAMWVIERAPRPQNYQKPQELRAWLENAMEDKAQLDVRGVQRLDTEVRSALGQNRVTKLQLFRDEIHQHLPRFAELAWLMSSLGIAPNGKAQELKALITLLESTSTMPCTLLIQRHKHGAVAPTNPRQTGNAASTKPDSSIQDGQKASGARRLPNNLGPGRGRFEKRWVSQRDCRVEAKPTDPQPKVAAQIGSKGRSGPLSPPEPQGRAVVHATANQSSASLSKIHPLKKRYPAPSEVENDEDDDEDDEEDDDEDDDEPSSPRSPASGTNSVPTPFSSGSRQLSATTKQAHEAFKVQPQNPRHCSGSGFSSVPSSSPRPRKSTTPPTLTLARKGVAVPKVQKPKRKPRQRTVPDPALQYILRYSR